MFIRVEYFTGHNSPSFKEGYLTSLEQENISIITCDRSTLEGAKIHFALGTLVGSTDRSTIEAKVMERQSVGGTPESWVIKAQFVNKTKEDNLIIENILAITDKKREHMIA